MLKILEKEISRLPIVRASRAASSLGKKFVDFQSNGGLVGSMVNGLFKPTELSAGEIPKKERPFNKMGTKNPFISLKKK